MNDQSHTLTWTDAGLLGRVPAVVGRVGWKEHCQVLRGQNFRGVTAQKRRVGQEVPDGRGVGEHCCW